MIIIEGPDGIGKTTLCKRLLERMSGHIYCHFSRLPPGFDFYWGYVDRMSRRIIQDRFHMTEIIYSTARGETPQIDPEVYNLLDAKLRLLGAFTVIITGHPKLIEKRWNENPQRQMYNLDKTLKAAKLFHDLATRQSSKTDTDSKNQPTLYDLYQPDFDSHIHLSDHEGNDHVTNTHIVRIMEHYQERQDAIDRLLRRKPITL